jgi:hypothetical protein
MSTVRTPPRDGYEGRGASTEAVPGLAAVQIEAVKAPRKSLQWNLYDRT